MLILLGLQRQRMDQRLFGQLFRACHEERINVSFMASLEKIMQLALGAMRRIIGRFPHSYVQ
ncbi:MAG: hypothetical protein KKF12_05985 [Proteobacteria bacterium]|nr:hypothetical protein [Desulfobacula sp.]MBU3953765.1 hypothetical protein [Pseudomonadota bacterium]MBU4130350.1 hypothetical protein [Pseudomonadota bacterium]